MTSYHLQSLVFHQDVSYQYLDNFGAILLAVIWVAPLLFAFWAAFHTTSDAVNFNLTSSWTLDNFRIAWEGAPWLKYFRNTFVLVTVVLIGQFIITTLAGVAFAQVNFPGKDLVFILDGIPVDFESFLSKIFMVLRSSVN